MHRQEALIVCSDEDVTDALRKIGLTKDIVVKVARSAAAARADALPVDPSSAPGLLSYIHGVRTIRLNLLKNGWRVSRLGNVESTVNDELGIQLCFQNVDVACNDSKIPHAISGKGAASRDLVDAGQVDLFANLIEDQEASRLGCSPTVWIICVAADESAVRAEVSCPTSFDGAQFEDFHRRIFVLDESFEPFKTNIAAENEGSDSFDVQISKK